MDEPIKEVEEELADDEVIDDEPVDTGVEEN